MAGNQHPAKDPETRDLFSKDEPVLGLTYEWSLGLSKRRIKASNGSTAP